MDKIMICINEPRYEKAETISMIRCKNSDTRYYIDQTDMFFTLTFYRSIPTYQVVPTNNFLAWLDDVAPYRYKVIKTQKFFARTKINLCFDFIYADFLLFKLRWL